jgi:signal transduction histidine kinase
MNLERNNRILVIDDNPAIHADFQKALGGGRQENAEFLSAEADLFGEEAATPVVPQFEISLASQGQEGYEMVRKAAAAGRPFAMAFIDVRMPPGWDGIQTTANIWKEHPELQVVICTAYSDYTWEEMARMLGASDKLLILKKPFDRIEVMQLACTLTEKWTLSRQVQWRMDDLERMVAERTASLTTANENLQKEINERIQAQKEREKMEGQLRQAQKLEAIGQLAAGIAHEINTPTQFISDNIRFIRDSFPDIQKLLAAHARFLADAESGRIAPESMAGLRSMEKDCDIGYLSAEMPKAIQQSLDGIERVAKIVGAMKDFSRPGTTDKVMTDLNKAIESTLIVCRNEWSRVAELVTELDPALPSVLVQPGEFNQVLLSLLINATHAIADAGRNGRGTITVTTRREGSQVEIRIRDNGTGIAEPIRHRIFEPFFSTKDVGRGSGQGLAVARSVVVDKHQGSLTFETETGQGTTFIIRLPV